MASLNFPETATSTESDSKGRSNTAARSGNRAGAMDVCLHDQQDDSVVADDKHGRSNEKVVNEEGGGGDIDPNILCITLLPF